jgi:predicted RNA binding protein YcfA (HicA-like mRNA interferase family)
MNGAKKLVLPDPGFSGEELFARIERFAALWREGENMAKKRRLLERVLFSPTNVRFGDMVTLVEAFGFHLSRIRGSHHIFVHPHVRELVNLQDVKGQAKPYQVKQFLSLVERYNLELGDEE